MQLVPIEQAEGGATLRSSADAKAMFAATFGGLDREALHIAYLDADWRVIDVVRLTGERASVELPVARIVREALILDCKALVLAHNHPSGDATPSGADKAMTRRLGDALDALRIRIADHLVFAGQECRSFRQMGLL